MKHREYLFFTSQKGFTLLELIMVIILIGIVAASAIMFIGKVLEQQSVDLTLKDMQNLNHAIVGNPDLVEGGVRNSFGYAGDMGVLPPTSGTCTSTCGSCGFVELVTQCGRPTWLSDADLPGTGYGWRGPYIDAKQDDDSRYLALLDGWGNYYAYNAATGQITSYGSDGISGGGDDITWPGSALTSNGTVTGHVTDLNGNPIVNNNVSMTYPNPASPGNATTLTVATDTNGVFTFNNIPIGKHKIQTTVGTTSTKAVTVLPNQTVTVDFSVGVDPTIPNTATGVTATRATLSSINVTWTVPTTNTDGSALVDLAGYQIYRSLNGASYSLLQSIGLGTVFSDTSLTAGQRYFYKIQAVDKSGNLSSDSAVSSTTVSPIRQTVASAFSQPSNEGACSTADKVPNCSGGGNDGRKALFTIQNTGNASDNGANITVNSMVVEWSGTGGSVRKILAPDVATSRYCNTGGASSGSTITLSSPLTINAGSSTTMGIYWCTTGGAPNNVQIQFNTVDGRLVLY